MPDAVLDTPPDAKPRCVTDRLLGSYESEAPGPTLIAVGGMHGNEPAGIIAIRRVFDRLHAERPPGFAGRLVGFAGNLSALNHPDRTARYLDVDINRLFLPAELRSGRDTVEHREARELLGAIEGEIARARGPVFLIDLHTVSSASPPFASLSDSLPARAFARHFPIPIFLGFEEHLPGLMSDYVTTSLGCVSMIVEGGQHDAPESVDVLEATVRTGLHAAGILALRGSPEDSGDPRRVMAGAAGGRARRVYDVRHREPIVSPEFAMEPGMDAFRHLGRHHPVIARDGGVEIVSPVSGQLFMPNRQPVKRPGDDGFFVVVEVGRYWLRLSAWLRQRAWVHAWLPRLLPGVRRREGHEGHLLIAPEIAAVLRRPVFHLLGYRLVRSSPVRDLSRPERIVRAGVAVAGSAWRMVAGALRGGERAALPDERPEDWVVTRRALDVRPPRDPRTTA